MTDDLTPLQSRITSIVEDEERLNRNRKSALGEKQARRDTEKRAEAAKLATLDKEREQLIRVNAETERKFQEEIKREGDELASLSKDIRDEYIAETRHREATKEKLQSKVSDLESKLRSIKSARS